VRKLLGIINTSRTLAGAISRRISLPLPLTCILAGIGPEIGARNYCGFPPMKATGDPPMRKSRFTKSQIVQILFEYECFGWMKTIGSIRKTKFRGRERIDWQFTLIAAVYNMTRMRNLTCSGS